MQIKLTSALLLVLGLTGCMNPMKSIEGDIASVKKDYAAHFSKYQGVNREMGFIWTGDNKMPPVVFVHGSPGSWEAWAAFLRNQDLQKKYHLIAIDRPGYGMSGHGNTEKSLAMQAENIIKVLEKNQSGKPAILIGHSMGGPVVGQIAADFPLKVRGLVIVAGSVDPGQEHTALIQYLGRALAYVIPTDLRVCNEEIMALKPELQKLEPAWQKFKIPVAVIQGEEDDLVPPANADFLKSRVPASKLVSMERVKGLNHFVPWKRPDLILKAIHLVDVSLSSDADLISSRTQVLKTK